MHVSTIGIVHIKNTFFHLDHSVAWSIYYSCRPIKNVCDQVSRHVRNIQRHFLAGSGRQVKFMMRIYFFITQRACACNTAQRRCPIPGQMFKECVDCSHNPATCKGHILGNSCTLECSRDEMTTFSYVYVHVNHK